jgi:hypothetical protein
MSRIDQPVGKIARFRRAAEYQFALTGHGR